MDKNGKKGLSPIYMGEYSSAHLHLRESFGVLIPRNCGESSSKTAELIHTLHKDIRKVDILRRLQNTPHIWG